MTSDQEGNQQPHWLIEPPAPGEIQFYIATGNNIELTEEIQKALDQMLVSLQLEDLQDVEGYSSCFPKCFDLSKCPHFGCYPLKNCKELSRYPCAARIDCKIQTII
jgi:hypothetical protein